MLKVMEKLVNVFIAKKPKQMTFILAAVLGRKLSTRMSNHTMDIYSWFLCNSIFKIVLFLCVKA